MKFENLAHLHLYAHYVPKYEGPSSRVYAHYVPKYEGPNPHGFLTLDTDKLHSIQTTKLKENS